MKQKNVPETLGNVDMTAVVWYNKGNSERRLLLRSEEAISMNVNSWNKSKEGVTRMPGHPFLLLVLVVVTGFIRSLATLLHEIVELLKFLRK